MRRFLRTVVAAFVLLGVASSARAACDSTISSGASIATAATNVANGGTVCLNAGTYSFDATVVKTSQTIITRAAGVTRAQVTLTTLHTNSSQFLTFDGFTVQGGEVGSGSRHIKLLNHNWTDNLCVVAQANAMDILIDGNLFANLTGCTFEGRLSIIGPSSGANGVTVSNNEFTGADSDGIQLVGDANGTVIGPGNYFHDITGCSVHCDSIQPYGAINTTITGNYFKNVDGVIADFDCNGSPMFFTNNVIDQGSGSAQVAVAFSGANGDTVIHNTFSSTSELHIYGGNESCSNSNMTIRDNVFRGSCDFTGSQSVSFNIITGGGQCQGTNGINGTPTFMGGANPSTWAGWQLTAGSLGRLVASDSTDMGAQTFGTAPPPVTAPSLTVTTPSAGTAETTAATFTTMAGTCTASSGRTISSVTWSNASGGSGTATGTTSWSIASISLTVDTANVVTVTCTDNTTEASQAAVSILRVSVPGAPTDAFTRGTWATLGPNWTEQTSTLLTTTSSQAFANIAGVRQCAFWSAHSFSNDQFSQIKITNLPTSGRFHYAAVRAAQTGDAAYDNYEVIADSTVGGAVIAKVINGTQTQLQTIGGITWALNDTLRLEITGDTLKAFRNGVQIGNNQAAGGQLTSGSAGICGYGGASLDDFTGGALSSDTTAPVVTIVSPTGNATYSVVSPALTSLSGTATDAVGVTSCTCTNSRGGSCTVTGTSAWSIGSVTMQLGSNVLTVSCQDLAVNVGSAQVTVTYAPVFTLFR